LGVGAPVYTRHRPERTLLYQIVEEYYPAFESRLASQGRALPVYVQCEFDDYLRCGRLEHGFLRVNCDSCHAEHLVAFSCTNSRRFRRTPRILSELWGTAYGRKCGAVSTDRCKAGTVSDLAMPGEGAIFLLVVQ
jgi:hypothetical protein